MKTFVRYAIFPAALVLAVVSGLLYSRAGLAPGVIVGLVSAVNIGILLLGERFLPYRREWQRSQGDILPDILHNLLNSYGFRELCKLATVALALSLTAGLAAGTPIALWPYQWPLWLQVILAMVIAEFGYYWVHRWSHEKALLWPFHSVHHSPGRLYWLNAGRDHPVGVAIFYLAGALPLIVLGAPVEALLVFYLIEAVHGQFQHANIDMRPGLLNQIFSSADLHRWHHSRRLAEANHNYGLTLTIWDTVFGTRYLPKGQAVAEVGIEDMRRYPSGFLGQMIAPLRWLAWQRSEHREKFEAWR